jgi:hypothetical protein
MSGQQYIDFAILLLTSSEEEVAIRSALSRYYYGLLHSAIDKLIMLDQNNSHLKENLTVKPNQNYSIHGGVFRAIRSQNQAVAASYDVAKNLRVFADYHFQDTFEYPKTIFNEDGEALMQFSSKEEIINYLNELANNITNMKARSQQSNPSPYAHQKKHGFNGIRFK